MSRSWGYSGHGYSGAFGEGMRAAFQLSLGKTYSQQGERAFENLPDFCRYQSHPVRSYG